MEQNKNTFPETRLLKVIFQPLVPPVNKIVGMLDFIAKDILPFSPTILPVQNAPADVPLLILKSVQNNGMILFSGNRIDLDFTHFIWEKKIPYAFLKKVLPLYEQNFHIIQLVFILQSKIGSQNPAGNIYQSMRLDAIPCQQEAIDNLSVIYRTLTKKEEMPLAVVQEITSDYSNPQRNNEAPDIIRFRRTNFYNINKNLSVEQLEKIITTFTDDMVIQFNETKEQYPWIFK